MSIAGRTRSGLGDVADDYVHIEKVAVPGDEFSLADTRLKWYDIRPADGRIDPAVGDEARNFLRTEHAAGRLLVGNDLGFVELHLCGTSFFFLIVCTWRNDNELWQTVYAKDGGRFEPVEVGSHRPSFCVWELGPVCHERLAWARYLRSSRDDAALSAYLADRFEGVV